MLLVGSIAFPPLRASQAGMEASHTLVRDLVQFYCLFRCWYCLSLTCKPVGRPETLNRGVILFFPVLTAAECIPSGCPNIPPLGSARGGRTGKTLSEKDLGNECPRGVSGLEIL